MRLTNNFILRFEYFGGLLISREDKSIFELDNKHTVFLYALRRTGSLKSTKEHFNSLRTDELEEFIHNLLAIGAVDESIYKKERVSWEEVLEISKEIDSKTQAVADKNYFSFPLQVTLYPSLLCNLNCSFCFLETKKDKNSRNNLSNLFDIVDQCDEAGVMTISILGGEPTMYPHLIELLQYIEKKKIHVSFTTNGTRITDKLVKFLQTTNYVTPVVSIQAFSEFNKEVMGVPFEVIQMGMKKLYEGNITFNVNTVFLKQDMKELKKIMDFCHNHSVKKFRLGYYLPSNPANTVKVNYGFAHARIVREELIEYLEQKNYSMNFMLEGCMFYSAYPEFLEEEITLTPYEALAYGCEAGNSKLDIMSDGRISACPAFSNSLFLEEPNAFEHNLTEVWEKVVS